MDLEWRGCKMKRLILAMTMMFMVSPALSQEVWIGSGTYYDGNKLYEFCQQKEGLLRAACVGYIIGAIDGTSSMYSVLGQITGLPPRMQKNNYYCLPANASAEQAVDVVIKWLKDNPSKRHQPATGAVWEAFANVWPCK